MQNPITLIILGNNQLDRVFQNLDQYQAYFSEIVIVDTSADHQLHQFAHKKIRVVTNDFQDQDFARLRNWAMTHATQPWILFLDSDEKLSQSLLNALPSFLKQSASGYSFRRIDYFHDQPLKHGEVGHVPKLRLFRKDQVYYQGKVHESAKVTGQTVFTDKVIAHYPHHNLTTFFQKINHYAQLQAQAEYQAGKRFQLVELLFKPSGKFLYNFLIKLGFLDGFAGLSYAVMMSLHSLFVRIYLYELSQKS